ncbi:Peptidyl-tRNA hydrolase ICT1, mitochondrial [Oryzias melastigma]|uniref:Large ribosomal subunit protein mL62 n=1 Tax=Oryzias melastigma TaxID=30732 RepID=A0A834L013_ORYME|nr:Peptidyl-tRNA hydrolase ICT1, mitochondrial [Oryzias melastigma]
MAACLTRRVCLLCISSRVHVSRGVKTTQIRDFSGSKGTPSSEDTKVHVPTERLTVTYSRSSGPGGQHVNKVNTKAEVRFHVHTADWIPEDIRQKVIEQVCPQKISAIIAEASEKPPEPTEEDIALRAARLKKRKEERLKQKKIHSQTKLSRRVDFD